MSNEINKVTLTQDDAMNLKNIGELQFFLRSKGIKFDGLLVLEHKGSLKSETDFSTGNINYTQTIEQV